MHDCQFTSLNLMSVKERKKVRRGFSECTLNCLNIERVDMFDHGSVL